jgi:hypothetical protein
MKNAVACVLLASYGVFSYLPCPAGALPHELQAVLPAAELSGQGKMTFLGFEVYQATLWITPGFMASAYEQSGFALELAYVRDFKGADIARRSVVEMRRQASLDPALEASWEARMRTLFPDVKPGDRITGVNLPRDGAEFWCNGRLLGTVHDSAFAKLFFGIWLAPQTSEPRLRQALLAQARPAHGGGATP